MDLLASILSVLLALFMLVSAYGKLTRMEAVVAGLDKAGVPHSMLPYLGAIQILGAVGLLVGLAVTGIGVAAAIGFVLYFAGAVGFHLRAGDRQVAVPAGLGVVALLVVVAYAA